MTKEEIMNPMPALEPALKQLRLSGILDSMEVRNKQAIEDGLSHVEFLAMLIQDEVARREQKKFSLRARRAGFRSEKTPESFDFSYNPSINKALVLDLATCRFLEEKAPVLIVGPCGTGKSHIPRPLVMPPPEKGTRCCLRLSASSWGCSKRLKRPIPTTGNCPPWPKRTCSSLTTLD
jgi:hypothetical protein